MTEAVIFGVTGQDGSYLAELLLSKKYQVTGVARRTSTPNTGRIQHLLDNSRFRLVQGDVLDFPCVMKILQEEAPDEVYNLAAQSHVGTSFTQPCLTWNVTAGGCLNILEAIRLLEYEPRFYQASSSEMFGSAYSVNTSGVYQDEKTPMLPNSPYAVAKLAGHHLCRIAREAYGIFACSGILFNHESPRRGEEFVTRKITRWLGQNQKKILSHQHTQLKLGNVQARRDWGHARDYVKAMWMMLQHDRADDYVISTGESHSVSEFLELAWSIAGLGGMDINQYVVSEPANYRPYEVPYLCGSHSRAWEVLGWKPEVSFEELVREMVLHDLDGV